MIRLQRLFSFARRRRSAHYGTARRTMKIWGLPVVINNPAECSVRCGGECCRRFVLFSDPVQRQAKYVGVTAWRDSGGEMEPWMHDFLLVCEMLIDTGERSWDDNVVYTCKHLDRDTGLCSIYDRRPKLCRTYPENGTACSYCGFQKGRDTCAGVV